MISILLHLRMSAYVYAYELVRTSLKVLIISTFYYGNFQQKAIIINILLRLRMSTYAYALVKTSL